MCTLALLGNASYPVSVRRLAGFATPLLSALPSRKGALRITSVPTTKFREDFHLRTTVHAGHTHENGRAPGERERGRGDAVARSAYSTIKHWQMPPDLQKPLS